MASRGVRVNCAPRLGMIDTGFCVPAGQLGRFTTFYGPDGDTSDLRVVGRPDGWWSAPPKLPMPVAGRSTADDLWAFASMLAAGGGDLLSAEPVRLMTSPEPTELVTDFWAAAYAAIDGT